MKHINLNQTLKWISLHVFLFLIVTSCFAGNPDGENILDPDNLTGLFLNLDASTLKPVNFSYTSSTMNVARCRHTATELSNGNILIAGGFNAGGVVSSAEIYNPDTKIFSVTGSMISQRQNHKAIRLSGSSANKNKVLLVAGSTGISTSTNVNTCELYDPSLETFTSTTSLGTARSGHSLTQMLDTEKVLLTGGNGSLKDVKVFTVGTPGWSSPGATIDTNRDKHSATKLADGRILLAGGSDDFSAVRFNAIITNRDDTYTMQVQRSGYQAGTNHTATLLPTGDVLFVGGNQSSTKAEIWSSTTNLFTLVGEYDSKATHKTVKLSNDGKALTIGGSFTATFNYSKEAYQYNETTRSFDFKGRMNDTRYDFEATAVGKTGQVLVTGGCYYDSASGTTIYSKTAELYTASN